MVNSGLGFDLAYSGFSVELGGTDETEGCAVGVEGESHHLLPHHYVVFDYSVLHYLLPKTPLSGIRQGTTCSWALLI